MYLSFLGIWNWDLELYRLPFQDRIIFTTKYAKKKHVFNGDLFLK